MEELGDAAAVLDAQADEGEDAHVGVQRTLLGQSNPALGAQQGIEIIDKVGEQVQEGAVEHLVEFRQVLVPEFVTLGNLVQRIQVLALDHLVDALAHLVKAVDVEGAQVDEASHILVLDTVRLVEFQVGLVHLLVEVGQLSVQLR